MKQVWRPLLVPVLGSCISFRGLDRVFLKFLIRCLVEKKEFRILFISRAKVNKLCLFAA